MVAITLTVGTVHDKIPADLRAVLLKSVDALETWEDITPLARNEWLCWVQSATPIVKPSAIPILVPSAIPIALLLSSSSVLLFLLIAPLPYTYTRFGGELRCKLH